MAAAVLVGVVIVSRGGSDDDAASASGAPGEVFAEPADDIGPLPFTPPVVTSAPVTTTSSTPPPSSTSGTTTSTTSTTTTSTIPTTVAPTATAVGATPPAGTSAGPLVVEQMPGATPGLYGGTRNNRVCDVAQLVSFLEANPDKGAAWAEAQGIEPSGIAAFVATLTPVLLRADTRVTNYGYDRGRPVARQAVLQAGTAVLVDARGVPRARCKCGNPLAEPIPVTGPPTYTGDTWPGFDPGTVQAVTPADQPLDGLVLTDPATGEVFERPVGTGGEADTPVTSSTVPPITVGGVDTTVATTVASTVPPDTTTGSTTASTTVPPSTAPVDTSVVTTPPVAGTPVDVTADGAWGASSEYPGGRYPADLAFDGDRTTSWFSAGAADTICTPITPGASCSDLIWVTRGAVDVTITSISILNNSQHPEYPTGFGFGSVTIEITDLAGDLVHTETIPLPGEDPDVVVTPNVRGHSIHLVFEGHDNPDCGGISELVVMAVR